jgi:hypothetical protein
MSETINKPTFDKETGMHSVIEAGFKYEYPTSLHDNFKLYIFQHNLVSRWYKQLSDEDRDKVIRSNAYETE